MKVQALQVERPPELPHDRYARRIVLTFEDGSRQILGNNPSDLNRLARCLMDVEPDTLPHRYETAKPVDEGLVRAPRTPPRQTVVDQPSAQALAEAKRAGAPQPIPPKQMEEELKAVERKAKKKKAQSAKKPAKPKPAPKEEVFEVTDQELEAMAEPHAGKKGGLPS